MDEPQPLRVSEPTIAELEELYDSAYRDWQAVSVVVTGHEHATPEEIIAHVESLRAIVNLGRRVCGQNTMNCIGAKLMKDAIEKLT